MASDEIKALLDHLEITAEERRTFEEAFPQAKSDVHILVTGNTGTGKSKLVNALTGAIVAREGASLKPESALVKKYEALSQDGYTINVWDSPGLSDGSDKERDSVRSIKEKCGDGIDMLLYCIDMSALRADVEEMSSDMALLTETLGEEVWSHALIILTFANLVAKRIAEESPKKETEAEMFQTKVGEWKVKVWSALKCIGVKPGIIAQIPIEPAGDYRTPDLPDRIHWLGYLWLQFLFQIKEEAKLAILMTNQNRIRSSEYLQPTGSDASTYLLIIHLESCKDTLWWKKYNALSKVKASTEDTGYRSVQIISNFCARIIKKMLEKKAQDMRGSK